MSDRTKIGLDNPAFSGRLRQPSGLAQSLHAAPKNKGPRPSARYFNDFSVRSASIGQEQRKHQQSTPLTAVVNKPKVIVQPQPVQAATTPAPTLLPATAQPPVTSIPAPELHRHFEQSQVLKRQALYKTPEPVAQHRIIRIAKGVAQKLQLSQYSRPQLAMMSMGIAVFMIGAFVSLSTLKTNHSATAQVEALSKAATEQPATTDSSQAAGSTTPTTSAPSTVQPTATTVSNYAVGPTQPRYLDIPRFDVHARVLSLGILNSGALATPNNVYDAGWYNSSSLPGQPGAMLMDGHVSSWTAHGVFYNLSKLDIGDQIKVTRGDGQVFTYEVVKSQKFDHDDVDMQSAITPVDPTVPGLNLITCTGQVIKGTNEFNQRILVYAKQV